MGFDRDDMIMSFVPCVGSLSEKADCGRLMAELTETRCWCATYLLTTITEITRPTTSSE